jgi:dolichyl-phosphate-mannose--protein O-mannosyl transferase
MNIKKFLISRDFAFVLLLLVVAACLRFPYIARPSVTEFDELIYRNYIVMTLAGQPSFDIHPPVTKLLLLEVAKRYEFPLVHSTEKMMQPFGDFPYMPMRRFVALFGVLLPLLIYAIGRRIGYGSVIAFIPAIIVATDPALILYSRVMLPDMILLLMIFAGLFFALLAAKSNGLSRQLFAMGAIILLGCAVSTKWTALATLATVIALFARKKMWGTVGAVFVVIPLIYVGSFLVFLQYFPSGGNIAPMFEGNKDPYNVEWITGVEYPASGNAIRSLSFLADFHQVILRANTDHAVNSQVYRPESPRDWPLGKSDILFWHSAEGAALIRLTGNVVLWSTAFLLFVYECYSLMKRLRRKEITGADEYELLLVAGYIVNYLPFFFISRPMYLYHYFTALLFLLLLAPMTLPRLRDDLVRISGRPRLPYILLTLLLSAAVICFVLLLPTTYGFNLFG